MRSGRPCRKSDKATIINLPDTVGYGIPEEYSAMFRRVIASLDGAEGITLSAHCHNDLGLEPPIHWRRFRAARVNWN